MKQPPQPDGLTPLSGARDHPARRIMRVLVTIAGLLALWQGIVFLFDLPPFILPGPWAVWQSLFQRWPVIGEHALITIAEIVIGLALGLILGVCGALLTAYVGPARRWLLPVLVASQAIPAFAIAPLLVLWLGYGMASKIAMAVIIIFFPVTSAFLDGLRQIDKGWIDMARIMTASAVPLTAPQRAGRAWRVFRHIHLPAALPALASGLRVAAAFAPIGAVVGEWVGSGAGLGYLMLHANGRMQIDFLFAALLVLAAFSICFWFAIDRVLKKIVFWMPDNMK